MDVSGGWQRAAVRVAAAGALTVGATVVAVPLAIPAQAAEKHVLCYFSQRQTAADRACLTKSPFTAKSSSMRYWACWKKQPSPKTHLRRQDAAGVWQKVKNTVSIGEGTNCGSKAPWSTETEVTVKRIVGPVTAYRFVLPGWSRADASSWAFSVCVLPLQQAKDDSIPCGWTPPVPEPTPTPAPTEQPTPA
jgi:hypothetical protein